MAIRDLNNLSTLLMLALDFQYTGCIGDAATACMDGPPVCALAFMFLGFLERAKENLLKP